MQKFTSFIGRENELSELNKIYRKPGFQFVVVYGRRRVGKTTLLRKFVEDKDHLYFVADEAPNRIELERFSKEIFEYFKMEYFAPFSSWEDAFRFTYRKVGDKRFVIVIDEFQYLAESDKSLISIFQRLIDEELVNTNLMLIFCGSYVSFMEKEILASKSPLYGRRTSQMEIEPLNFFEAKKFFENYTMEEKVLAYSILGGIPQYLRSFSDDKDIFENIKENIMNKYSYLYDEPVFLLRQELREPSIYNAILKTIAQGGTKLNEISTKIHFEAPKVSKYLDVLEGMKIVRKVKPLDIGKSSRASIYEITDNFFRFWYRFIFDNKELIEKQMEDIVLENTIKPFLNSYVGKIFELISMYFLFKLNSTGYLPFVFTKIGKWWGNNPTKKREEKIDILAYSDNCLIIGECKWSDKNVGVDVFYELLEKASLFNFEKKFYILFSKNGFTKELRELSKHDKDILLFELKDFEDI